MCARVPVYVLYAARRKLRLHNNQEEYKQGPGLPTRARLCQLRHSQHSDKFCLNLQLNIYSSKLRARYFVLKFLCFPLFIGAVSSEIDFEKEVSM